MAKTQIADVIVPDVFQNYVIKRTAELSALFTSGIVERTAEFDKLASGAGKLINMPFWNDLTGDDEVLSDGAALTPAKLTAGQDVAVKLLRGKAWSTNDLAGELAGSDPMAAIGDLVASFWVRKYQAALINILAGVFAATSMSGNVHDISALTDGAELISGSTFIDAAQKLGDAKDKLTGIVMHSAVAAYLAKNDLIQTIRDSEGRVTFKTFMGKVVLEDDSLTPSTDVYTTYLFGAGAIAYGEGNPDNPVEVGRDVLAGDDVLVNRRHFILHPRGVAFQNDSVAGASPTNAELATGTNWARVYDNKLIRIVQFKHKIG